MVKSGLSIWKNSRICFISYKPSSSEAPNCGLLFGAPTVISFPCSFCCFNDQPSVIVVSSQIFPDLLKTCTDKLNWSLNRRSSSDTLIRSSILIVESMLDFARSEIRRWFEKNVFGRERLFRQLGFGKEFNFQVAELLAEIFLNFPQIPVRIYL